MELPRVNGVGIVEYPAGYRGSPRCYPRRTRGLALAVLITFAGVTLATGVASLGAYCLTTDAADTRSLPGR